MVFIGITRSVLLNYARFSADVYNKGKRLLEYTASKVEKIMSRRLVNWIEVGTIQGAT